MRAVLAHLRSRTKPAMPFRAERFDEGPRRGSTNGGGLPTAGIGPARRHEDAAPARGASPPSPLPAFAQPRPRPTPLRAIADQVSEQRLRATVERLVGFGTRHTLSARDHPTRGIGAALNWTEREFRRDFARLRRLPDDRAAVATR